MNKNGLLAFTFITVSALNAQTGDLALGVSLSNLERFSPYGSQSSPLNTVLTVGYSQPLCSKWGPLHQFRIATSVSPNKQDHAFSYGYQEVAGYYVGSTDTGRFSWTVGLSARRETYHLQPYLLINDPNNPVVLSPGIEGSMVRPYLSGGFAYSGAIIPFHQESKVRFITRLLGEKVLYTPQSQGVENTLRKNLNQQMTTTLQLGVLF